MDLGASLACSPLIGPVLVLLQLQWVEAVAAATQLGLGHDTIVIAIALSPNSYVAI